MRMLGRERTGTSGERGVTSGERYVRRTEPLQIVRESSLSGKPGEDPDGSPVNRGRGGLCCSGAEKSICLTLMSVQFALIAAREHYNHWVGSSERRRTSIGARPLLRTTKTWLSDDTRSSVRGPGRDFAAEDMQVGWSSATTLDLQEEAGVHSTHLVELGRGNGNGKATHPAIRVVEMPAVRAKSDSRIWDQTWAWDGTNTTT
ncbi:hypothetical protein DFH94DRAFT_755967 [Russula ochroleuca]|jgi:hypothetical protein|uniref:Uncharacterized protein n=1 Tax=Russula ochroleuca TaxID=152965 RepID=A0A9P5T608_9AGAM|nr:hypothetical protein DFH94DRAFT_755967 [Russula ochroleuca]